MKYNHFPRDILRENFWFYTEAFKFKIWPQINLKSGVLYHEIFPSKDFRFLG